MKMRLLVGVAAVALGAASGAMAQSATSGWYVAGDVGYHEPADVKATSTNNYQWTFSTDKDWAAFGRFGYKFTPNWRVEAEYGYRPADVQSVRGAGVAGVTGTGTGQPIGLCTAGVGRTSGAPTCGEPDGKFKASTLMANVLFDVAPNSSFNPFIGAGVGTAWVHNKVYGQLSGVPTGAAIYQNTSFDDVDQAFAMQGIVGVGWNFAQNWSMDLTGRYIRTSKLDWGSVTQNARPGRWRHHGRRHVLGPLQGHLGDPGPALHLRVGSAAPAASAPAAPAAPAPAASSAPAAASGRAGL
jgi:OOP family OmpA-OmpF porin